MRRKFTTAEVFLLMIALPLILIAIVIVAVLLAVSL